MELFVFIVMAALFVILTPCIVVCIPPKSPHIVSAITHGVIFSAVWYFIHKPLMAFSQTL